MIKAPRNLLQFLTWGTFQGLATCAAYAVTEFVFVSLVGLMRPYSRFTNGYWQMSEAIMAGYLAAGIVAGIVAGALAYALRNRLSLDPSAAIERITVIGLVTAFLCNVVSAPTFFEGWLTQLMASLAFAGLVVAGLWSKVWFNRLRYITNPWVISFLLLGLGQDLAIRDLSLARQLGNPIDLWTTLLTSTLVVVAFGAVLLGYRLGAPGMSRFATYQALPSAALLFILVPLCAALGQAPADERPVPMPIPAAAKPNVFLIVLDTVRADHLSLDGYGRRTTPNLEELARDSTVYSNVFAPSDFTLTSHASLFTGMYPSWHGAYCDPPEAGFGRDLSPKASTLAEILGRSGYRTLGVSANLYLRADFGLQRGFGSFRIPRPVPVLNTTDNWYLLRTNLRRALARVIDTAQFDRPFSRSEDVNREFFETFRTLGPTGAPFFAFLNFMDAHYPYVPPAPFDLSFPGKIPGITQDDLDRQQESISSGQSIPAGYRSHTISQYDGGIVYMDAQAGKLIEWLKTERIYDSTMIIVTADHGESFGERSRIGHANSAYQNLLHVPLIIKYPKSSQRGIVEAPVSLVDVAPTVLAVLGLANAPQMQGTSLLESPAKNRNIYGETFPCPVLHSPDCPRGCTFRTIVSWPNKLITTSNGNRELFDLAADPDETRNLYGSRPDLAQSLTAELGRWMKTMPKLLKPRSTVDQRSLQQLRGLGYLK